MNEADWEKVVGEAWTESEVKEALEWQFHCFQPHQTFTIARLPLGNSFKEFHRNSQSYQAKLLQFSTERFRSMKWRGTTGLKQKTAYEIQ